MTLTSKAFILLDQFVRFVFVELFSLFHANLIFTQSDCCIAAFSQKTCVCCAVWWTSCVVRSGDMAVLEFIVIDNEKLLSSAKSVGKCLIDGFCGIMPHHPMMGDVRSVWGEVPD